MNIKNVKPFLKWAGGKTQLLPTIIDELPSITDEISTYVEPFLGAGSVFLDFLSKDMFDKYIVNDVNSKLINVYLNIRDNIDALVKALSNLSERYLSLEELSKDREAMYYEIRSKFNDHNSPPHDLNSAAYFIFLNKACFNGLYRENSKGKFNVPIGSYKNPKIFSETQLRDISALLNKKNSKGEFVVTIMNCCFLDLEKFIDKDTFVYFDPPYRPVTANGFSTYNKSGFNDENQKKLADFYSDMSLKGAKLMLSNSNPRVLDDTDDFFEVLYNDFNIQKIYANRFINSNGKRRGDTSELLITNYIKENTKYIGDEENIDSIPLVYKKLAVFNSQDDVFEYLTANMRDFVNKKGREMEEIVENSVRKICDMNDWKYKSQGTISHIESEWNLIVPSDKNNRMYDFIINKNGKLLFIQINHYRAGGCKLKDTANEIAEVDKYIRESGFQFCWITDGKGWNTSKKPLKDAFDKMRYIFNLEMIEKGALEYLVESL